MHHEKDLQCSGAGLLNDYLFLFLSVPGESGGEDARDAQPAETPSENAGKKRKLKTREPNRVKKKKAAQVTRAHVPFSLVF